MSTPTVLLWGHQVRPGCNTLAWCWNGFARAFASLGWQVICADDTPEAAARHASLPAGTLVFAEGQEDRHLQHRSDWTYVLHNCDWTAYEAVRPRCLALQVYTHDALEREVNWFTPFCGHQTVPGCLGILYQPWATDLLPNEIRLNDAYVKDRLSTIAWCGTVGDGRFGNAPEITRFQNAHRELAFVHRDGQVDPRDHREFISRAALAPTLVGRWQNAHGYLPCRAFKNVSYGQPCLTNSATIAACLGLRTDEWHPDPARIPTPHLDLPNPKRTVALMRLVQAEHTFVNRALRILEVAGVG